MFWFLGLDWYLGPFWAVSSQFPFVLVMSNLFTGVWLLQKEVLASEGVCILYSSIFAHISTIYQIPCSNFIEST